MWVSGIQETRKLSDEWIMDHGHVSQSSLNFGSTGPCLSEIADFEPIIAHSTSAIIPSEKSSINSNRKSPTRFPTNLRWLLYVAPKSPEGGLKRPFFLYNCNSLEESLLQSFFVCVKTVSGRVVRHSFAFMSVYKWLGYGDVPFYLSSCKTPISNLFSLVVPQA